MQRPGSAPPRASRRLGLGIAAVVVVPVGLAARFLLDGWVGDAAGGVLYAVLVYLLVAVVAPFWRPRTVAVLALAISCAVELLQLTPLPRELAAAVPAVRLVLGSTFVPSDLVAYLLGVVVASAVDHRAISAAGHSPR
ncbi:DUF2809 domain-containing protein [Arthrobacter sp. JSM 101049]|uniref:ribosomal maturation YjgA family protein n=1 Tax=Arthrobacter sp. JSM 101049 TaxID=929097 RepID=UPI00356A30C8